MLMPEGSGSFLVAFGLGIFLMNVGLILLVSEGKERMKISI